MLHSPPTHEHSPPLISILTRKQRYERRNGRPETLIPWQVGRALDWLSPSFRRWGFICFVRRRATPPLGPLKWTVTETFVADQISGNQESVVDSAINQRFPKAVRDGLATRPHMLIDDILVRGPFSPQKERAGAAASVGGSCATSAILRAISSRRYGLGAQPLRNQKKYFSARVSTTSGQDPEMQLRELRDYCERRGWEVAREYVDTGISGAKEKRPELDRLLADAHRRHFDAVVVSRFDRFGRSVSHLLQALETSAFVRTLRFPRGPNGESTELPNESHYPQRGGRSLRLTRRGREG